MTGRAYRPSAGGIDRYHNSTRAHVPVIFKVVPSDDAHALCTMEHNIGQTQLPSCIALCSSAATTSMHTKRSQLARRALSDSRCDALRFSMQQLATSS